MSTLQTYLKELGVHVDPQLLELAFAHRSWAYENGQVQSNERLEFLGDAVLQIIVTEYIYTTFPQLPEGQMAKLRSSVVSADPLAAVARQLDLGSRIKLGQGEINTQGQTKKSILSDACEALIGAVHLSGGRDASTRFVLGIFQPMIDKAQADGVYADHKTVLQELAAARGWDSPVYEVTGSGPDHERTFTAEVIVDGTVAGKGSAPSKRRAEQIAAQQACLRLADSGA